MFSVATNAKYSTPTKKIPIFQGAQWAMISQPASWSTPMHKQWQYSIFKEVETVPLWVGRGRSCQSRHRHPSPFKESIMGIHLAEGFNIMRV